MQRRIGNVDLDTGEIFEHVNIVAFTAKRRNGFIEGWAAMSQVAISDMLANQRKELGSEGLSVLLFLVSEMQAENRVIVNKTALGKAIGMDPRNVRRAFVRLLGAEIISEAEPMGMFKSYVVSPEIAWKGAAKNHVIALNAYRKAKDGSTYLQSHEGGEK